MRAGFEAGPHLPRLRHPVGEALRPIAPQEVRTSPPTARVIPNVPAMTIACAVHWYESLLFIAPVAMTVGVIWVMSRIERRREEREAAGETRPAGFEPATSSSGGTRSIQLS